MERQQYIQDLVNQNLTDEEIFAKLDEFDNDTDPPKKTTDPVKTETSAGSSNTVSNLENGSLGLQALTSQEELTQDTKPKKPKQIVTEYEVPEGVDPEEFRKRMEEATAAIYDYDKIEPVEIKAERTIPMEALTSDAGVRVWFEGDYMQRYMATKFVADNAIGDVIVPELGMLEDRVRQKEEYETIQTEEGRVPYSGRLMDFMKPTRGVETFEETFDPETDVLGIASGDKAISKFFRGTGEFIDRAVSGYKPPEVYKYAADAQKGQDIMFVSFSGKEPESIKENKQINELAVYDPITDTFRGGKERVTKLPPQQYDRINALITREHLAQSSKYKTEDLYIDHVYNEGDKFLTREEQEYKALKERYNSTKNPNEKKDIKMKLNALDFGQDLFDEKGNLISYDKKSSEKESKEKILVQEKLGEIIKNETDEDVLKKSLAVSYSKLITHAKEIKQAGIEIEKSGLLKRSIKNINADPYVYLSGFLGNIDEALKTAETGDVSENLKLLGGDHPLADAFNDALVEFKALNRAIKLNIDPIKDEVEVLKNFTNGLIETAEGYLGDIKVSELTTERDEALAIDGVLNRSGYDTDSKSYKIEKDNIYNYTAKEVPAFVSTLTEFLMFRRAGGGAGLKIENSMKGINRLRKINPLYNFGSKVVNTSLNIGLKSTAEAVTFTELELLKGNFEAAPSSFKQGFGLGLVGSVTNPLGAYATKIFFNNPIGRAAYKYNSARFLTNNAISSTLGGSQFVIADAIGNSGEYKNADGSINFEKIKEKTISEAFKFSMYNLLPNRKAWAKDFVYGLNADVKEMFNNPSVELGKAASDFNISLKDINKNKQGIQQEIEEKRLELIENKSEEEVEEINQQALILTNQSNVALYNQYVNPRKEFTDREIFETGYNLINGKKLNARQSEVAAQVPSAVIYKSIKSTDNRSARETMQYLDAKQKKYELIEANLNHGDAFKTSWRTEKQRTKVANLLDEALDLTSEKLRLEGKDKSIRTPEENSRILDLELQIEQSFKDAKYISDKAFEDGFRKINKQAGRIGKEKIVVLSEKDFNSKAEEVTGEALSEKDGVLGFFDEATNTRYINEDAARATKTITTAMHETGHFVLKDSLKDKETGKVSEDGIRIIDEVLSELNESQKELIQKRIDENYRFDEQGKEIPKEEYYEEYLTVLSEEIADKNIVFNKSIGEALLDIVPFMRKSGLPSLEMSDNTGKELFNLISSYSSGKAAGARKATQLSEIESESEGAPMSKKKTVLEEINNLLPESIKTKEQFLSDRSFTKVYESAMNPGGAINNYIKSRASSAMEAELAVDSVLERLMNFDPGAKRKDGSTIGREGFGEFIFANTAFGKLDAKKKLFQESERKSKETSIDESTKQIADVETVEETQAEVKEKPSINPLKFEGVPENIELSDAPGEGLTFKKVGKQYAGEVGEQALGISAKKITDPSANLGSLKEARAIQQFFFKGNNLERFIKILPEFNIANKVTKVGIEKLDVPRDVFGTSLGLPNTIIKRFYRSFVDPTGETTSKSGRSRGLKSQTTVFRLKKEFRGNISKETLDQVKREMGITPKGELNILPKGELRSPIGQLLKGMAKTYSTLAANTLVRQKMTEASASKEEVARVAGGKRDIMLSRKRNIKPEQLITDSKGKKALEDQDRVIMGDDFKPTKKELVAYAEEKTKDVNKSTGLPVKVVEKGIQFLSTGNKAYLDNKRPYLAINNRENKNRDGTINEEQTAINKKAEKDGLVFVAKDALEISKTKPEINYVTGKPFTEQETIDLKAAFREKYDGNIDRNVKELESINRGKELAYRLFSDAIKRDPSNSQYISEVLYNGGLNKNIGRSMAPTLGKQADILKGGKTDEHTLQNVVHADWSKKFMTRAGKSLNGWIKWANENYYQIAVKKRRSGTDDLPQTDEFLNMKYPIDGKIYNSKDELHPEIAKALTENFTKDTEDFSNVPDSAVRMFDTRLQEKVTKEFDTIVINANTTTFLNGTFASHYNVEIPSKYHENLDILIKQNEIIYEVASKKIDRATARDRMDKVLKVKENSKVVFSKNKKKFPEVTSKFSKSNEKLLNNLSNYDKALRNARDPKAPIKGISVFDFDDTLATTKSMVGVTMPDGTKTKIDATEFAKTGENLLEQGATFDFSDFSRVVGGEPGPLITKLDKAIKKFGNKDVFVLTARPANSAPAIHEFLKGLGYEIPLENITGLANSAPEAKAQWMVDKAAEGYNDFYFTDDAYKNVKAVQDAMKVLDVKSKERIVYKDIYDKMDREFNDILEAKSGIASEKVYSKAKAEVVGSSQGKFKWFIPPSADDFVGLLYNTLAKGKLGDNQMAWYKKNLLDPYARAMNNISSERVSLAADYKALKKQLGIVPKNLRKKIEGEGFTKEQAVRMYIWNKQGMDIPGLSKSDLADMVKYVESDASLKVFADQLIEINKGDGYPEPKDYWLAGSITTDLMDGLGGTKRAKHLEEWQQNVDAIFSEKNLNKLEAVHGKAYREALENMLQRMKSGKNRNYAGDSTTGRMMDWLNGSIGAIMFLNTRSAVLQTLSAVNFINFKDNNILAAGKAFANQPQYWKDFKELFNSDFLKERRDNATININESDIAEMANKGGAKGAISYLLQKGFTPTQIADSFAIASGGATFYRNRIKSYIKQGMSEAEAKEKAFLDFRETAEESQQSSRPDRISKQQAGPLGRVVLAFANTPSQYARIIKKASQDLMAGRGDAKTNISKIIYYGAVQGFIFNAIQQALFAADLDDEDEKTEKMVKLGNGMADGVLRGMGVSGAAVAVVKNAGLRVYNESQKDRPKYEKVAFELTKLSPPIASKLSRINQAAREVQWNSDEMKQKGFSLDNPAWLAAGNVISATTNIPLDRVIKKVNNVNDALSQDLEMQERIALLAGWQSWELGIDKKEKEDKDKSKTREIKYRTTKYRTIKYR